MDARTSNKDTMKMEGEEVEDDEEKNEIEKEEKERKPGRNKLREGIETE